jgi:predicted kinase
MNTFIMLCGVPGSGKSTYVKDYIRLYANEKVVILSTDDIIQNWADMSGKTYDDVFSPVEYAEAERMMIIQAETAFRLNGTVIWDQTNLTPKGRAKKLKMVPNEWYKIAINFVTPAPEILDKRLKSRVGKTIPSHIMASMIKNFLPATQEEGFNLIGSPSDINGVVNNDQ